MRSDQGVSQLDTAEQEIANLRTKLLQTPDWHLHLSSLIELEQMPLSEKPIGVAK